MRQFHEIIDQRRQDLGLTVEDVFERLDHYRWPKGTKAPALASVGHWFNGTRKRPRDMNHVRAICSVLELEIGEAFGEDSAHAQTDVEQVMLKKLRKLSPDDQEIAMTLIESLIRKGAAK
jgi:hypothetical protein